MEIIPTHVSIIMDGNGRWAKQRGKERVFGHHEGVESVRVITTACAKAGVKYLSLFAFSEENWNRPAAEVNALMSLMLKALKDELPLFMENGIRFLVRGNIARLSDKLRSEIKKIEDTTASNSSMTLVVMMSYSGKWDILQAAKRMALELPADKIASATNEDFQKYLVMSDMPDPDLIIRTSGEQRISNYMLWQAAYSEFYYTDVLWPDFREPELQAAFEAFAKRDRRYGKVK